jgi:hypothetical protein
MVKARQQDSLNEISGLRAYSDVLGGIVGKQRNRTAGTARRKCSDDGLTWEARKARRLPEARSAVGE